MNIELNVDDLLSFLEPLNEYHSGKYNNWKHGQKLKNDKKTLAEGVAGLKSLIEILKHKKTSAV